MSGRGLCSGATVRILRVMDDARNTALVIDAETLPDDYDERPVEGALELAELVRLRAELSWADWKAHPRFKKDRVIREAQRRLGISHGDAPAVPAVTPANDVGADNDAADADAELARDEAFAAFCDARRDAWMDQLDARGDEV